MNRKIQAFVLSACVLAGVSGSVFAQDANLILPNASYTGAGSQVGQPLPVMQGIPGANASLPQAAPEKKTDPASVNDDQFKAALSSIAPMSPAQIEYLRRQLDERDRAQGKPLAPVGGSTRSIAMSMKPGETTPVIHVSPGWVTTLTFSDVTGQPWPVLSVTRGNPDAYEALSSGPAGATNIITISTKQPYIPSNIAVTLIGAKVPLLLTLDPSGANVDYRVDAQLDQRGPNASYDMGPASTLTPTNDSAMLAFLDGVAPDGAVKLKVADHEVQAWRYNDLLYVRTGRTMMSPAYTAKQSNVSGTNVYVLNEAPVLLLSDAGRMFSVQIQR